MQLRLLPETFAICRLGSEQEIPGWALRHKNFLSITYTADELSLVCSQTAVPASVHCERDWKAFQVIGPLDFSLTGILAALTTPLASGRIPLFAISTFDTDYILVKTHHVEKAVQTPPD